MTDNFIEKLHQDREKDRIQLNGVRGRKTKAASEDIKDAVRKDSKVIAAKKSAYDPSRKPTRDITRIENTKNKNKEQKRVKTEHRVSTRNKTANKAANL